MKIHSIFAMLLVMVQLAYGQPDWISKYYENPAVDDFSHKIRSLLEAEEQDKSEYNPELVGFISQVMAQNPTKVKAWLVDFERLSDTSRTTVLVAAWFSGTEQSRAYFKERGLEQYLQTKPTNLLNIKVQTPDTLDLLWGMFAASGDVAPIERIISSFELAKYKGSLNKYKYESQTEQTLQNAYMEATYQAAVWSLEERCKQQPRLLSLCEKIYSEKKLTKSEQEGLQQILKNVKPEKYQQKEMSCQL